MPRRRILFFAEGATMAHFVRPLALADSLDTSEYEILFCAPARFSRYLHDRPFAMAELSSMPGEQFLANIAQGAPMFPSEVLRGYVRQDRDLINGFGPDLVVGDMRLSLAVSARLEKVKYAAIINAYWSPYGKYRAILPEIPITRVIPPGWLKPVYRMTEPMAYAMHVGQMNRVRKEFGLGPLPPDLRVMYTDGDYVLYADIPEFVPTVNAPKSHYYVGICNWNQPIAKPAWWDGMVADPKPKVFVTLGSSGPVRAFPALLNALGKLPVSTIVSTSGRDLEAASAQYVADLLPFTETAAVSSVVVSHGGSGGLYPAMAAGTPVLGIPSNADQHLSTAVLAENGAGLGVRVEEASEQRLRSALEDLLFEPRFRSSAKSWAVIYAKYDSGQMFRSFLKEVVTVAPAAKAT